MKFPITFESRFGAGAEPRPYKKFSARIENM